MVFKRQIFFIISIVTLILVGVVSAGSLTPTTLSPDTTYVTLGDLYSKIGDSTYSTSSRSFDPAGTPAGTGYTLSQVYNLIQTPSADTIISSKTARGVSGTYDISNLTPDKVRSGITYGTSSVGTWEAGPPQIVVAGPLTDSMDRPFAGTYLQVGTVNGKPVYLRSNGDGTAHFVYWVDYSGPIPAPAERWWIGILYDEDDYSAGVGHSFKAGDPVAGSYSGGMTITGP